MFEIVGDHFIFAQQGLVDAAQGVSVFEQGPQTRADLCEGEVFVGARVEQNGVAIYEGEGDVRRNAEGGG